MHIDHINIRAPADLLEQVRDFYCALLGLEEGFRPNFTSSGYWLYANDRPLVHLSLGGGAPGPTPRSETGSRPESGLDHVAFRSSGVDVLRERLDGRGVPYRVSYVAELDLSQVFFTDPVGTGIEVNFPGERVR
ncbi:MAG: diguanylate cyclase [Xanthomonadales bacterium]|nr:diguanylate cyclase [Xanthomonadales bacterium]